MLSFEESKKYLMGIKENSQPLQSMSSQLDMKLNQLDYADLPIPKE